MRTDADDPARVRDPTIELLLSHTATLTDEWLQPPAAYRQRLARIGEIRPAAKWFYRIGREIAALCVSDVDHPNSYNQRATARTSAKRSAAPLRTRTASPNARRDQRVRVAPIA
jgi:hypothetical protein